MRSCRRSCDLRHDGVEWRRPAQLRNRIVHGYWSIDLEILVSTAHDDLQAFVESVRSVIDQLSVDEPETS